MPEAMDSFHRAWRFKLTSMQDLWAILDLWAIVVFLVAVFQLFQISGLDGSVLVFLVPPALAFLVKHVSERQSSRFVAVSFITLVSMGEVLSHLPKLCPWLGGVEARLAPEQDRILSWYLFVYLLYILEVVPLFVFIRGLIDHSHQRATQFSKFTCVLGIVACIIVLLGMIPFCCQCLGLLPK